MSPTGRAKGGIFDPASARNAKAVQ